jgi:hypothetical protein
MYSGKRVLLRKVFAVRIHRDSASSVIRGYCSLTVFTSAPSTNLIVSCLNVFRRKGSSHVPQYARRLWCVTSRRCDIAEHEDGYGSYEHVAIVFVPD